MNKNHLLRLFGINSAGIKSKIKTLDDILVRLKPHIWMIQESKLKENETLKCDASNAFQMYYLSRRNSGGGGLIMGVDKNLESTQIREGDDEIEVISVQIIVEDLPLRIILGYGPQENADAQKKEKFWVFLEREINEAEGEGIILQMDGNLHAGNTLIKDDPNPQNMNGKLFMDFLREKIQLLLLSIP